MHDTLLSLQREIESKMCLTGRQRKLWFLSKKRKNVSDWICFIFLTEDLWCLFVSFSATTKAGSSDHHQPRWVCVFWFVCMRVCYSLHSTPHNNTEYLHGASRTGLFGHMSWSWGLCDFSYSHNKHQLHPKSKNLQKEAFSHDLSAFPQSCRSTPGVPVPEQRVQPALLRLYGKLNVLSMHLGESWNCIQSSGRDRWGSQEGCSPICLKYLAALIHFD